MIESPVSQTSTRKRLRKSTQPVEDSSFKKSQTCARVENDRAQSETIYEPLHYNSTQTPRKFTHLEERRMQLEENLGPEMWR